MFDPVTLVFGESRVFSIDDPRANFLDKYWMFGAFALAPVWAFFVVKKYEPEADLLAYIALLTGPMYMLHMFETHGYDIFGNRYSGMDRLNSWLPAFMSPFMDVPLLSCKQITRISIVILAQLIGFSIHAHVSGRLRRIAYVVASCCFKLWTHVISFALSGRYNPGLMAALMFVGPLTFWLKKYLETQRPSFRIPLMVLAGPINNLFGYVAMTKLRNKNNPEDHDFEMGVIGVRLSHACSALLPGLVSGGHTKKSFCSFPQVWFMFLGPLVIGPVMGRKREDYIQKRQARRRSIEAIETAKDLLVLGSIKEAPSLGFGSGKPIKSGSMEMEALENALFGIEQERRWSNNEATIYSDLQKIKMNQNGKKKRKNKSKSNGHA